MVSKRLSRAPRRRWRACIAGEFADGTNCCGALRCTPAGLECAELEAEAVADGAGAEAEAVLGMAAGAS